MKRLDMTACLSTDIHPLRKNREDINRDENLAIKHNLIAYLTGTGELSSLHTLFFSLVTRYTNQPKKVWLVFMSFC